MSLAMYAAPFDNDSSEYKNNDNDNIINKKRQTHNKTQKKYPKENFDQEKVNSVLEKIHNNSNMDEEDTLANFSPPPKPESVGVSKTIATEEMQNMREKLVDVGNKHTGLGINAGTVSEILSRSKTEFDKATKEMVHGVRYSKKMLKEIKSDSAEYEN